MRLLRALAFALAIVLFGHGALAQEDAGQAVMLVEQGFSFVLPADWEQQPIPEEALGEGVVYAARSDDGCIQLFVQLKPLQENMGIEALAAFSIQGENVFVDETMEADGTAFLLSGEVFQDGETTLVYRTANGIHEGRWICFIWVDLLGNGAEVARRTVRSFQSLPEKTEDTIVVYP